MHAPLYLLVYERCCPLTEASMLWFQPCTHHIHYNPHGIKAAQILLSAPICQAVEEYNATECSLIEGNSAVESVVAEGEQ